MIGQKQPAVLTEADIIRRFIEFRVADIHTAMPGQVVAFDPLKNTVKVQPLLQRVYIDAAGEETVKSAPQLEDVPVWYPRGGGFRITWDLVPGDIVLLLFCERSIDAWSQTGGEADPRPRRKHDWSDAVAVPGLAPVSSAIAGIEPQQLLLGAEDGTVEVRLDRATGTATVKGTKIALGGAGGQPVGRVGDQVSITPLTAPDFFAWIASVSSAGPATVPPYTGAVLGQIAAGSPVVDAT